MPVLVTGGCGYIGSHVVKTLSELGETCIVLDDLSMGNPRSLLHDEPLFIGSCGDLDLLDKIFQKYQIDAVLHFAAHTRVHESMSDPLKYYLNNSVNTAKLIQSVALHKIPYFIFSSTAAVYGNPSDEEGFVEEEDLVLPVSPYGHSKAMAEQILADAATGRLNYIILRYFNVAGASPDGRIGERTPNASYLIKVACEVAVGKREDLMVNGTDYPTPDGTCVRDYIHVQDLADAHIRSLQHLRKGGGSGVFNCGYGHGFSVKEIVDTVKKVSKVNFPVSYGPRRSGDAIRVIARSDKIKRALNWEPKFDDIKKIVSDAYRWELYLKNKEFLDY